MEIFIDESGIFAPSDKPYAWSTVAALAVPESSIHGVTNALRDLKKALNVQNDVEIKYPRPDSKQSCFINFLKKLKNLNCTLHVVTTNCSLLEKIDLSEHQKNNIKAIYNFKNKIQSDLEDSKFDRLSSHIDTTISVMQSISMQEYVQCIMQTSLVSLMLEKLFYFYALKNPQALSSFSWVIDQKSVERNRYERTFDNVLPGLVEVNSVKRSKALPIKAGTDYSYLAEFMPDDIKLGGQDINYYRNVHGKDLTAVENNLLGIDYYKICNKDRVYSDSKDCIGLQVVDLLVSSVNRCLKTNFSDNEKMAKCLGSLLINSPRINELAASMVVLTDNDYSYEFNNELLKLMDEYSIKLYNETFRKNFTANVEKIDLA